MLTDTEKQAVRIAASRYGVDGGKVQQIVDRARSRGDMADLLTLLLQQDILTDAQVKELRRKLGAAQIVGKANGSDDEDIHGAATVLPPEGSRGADEDAALDLKTLGDYRILRRLGGGGMGSVFLGYLESQHRPVALKVLSPSLSGSPAMVDRFYREGRSGAHLNHPNIVRNLAVGQDRATGLHYLVLEYVDGPSALELLEQKGHLSVGDALSIALDVGRALEHAHSRNIVHRDIKPGNILITRTGVAKLADMGLAKRTDESSSLTLARQGFGTPYYMPYEQAMNARTADFRSDIYALGATLYHLLTGEVPFPGANSIEIVDRKAIGDFTPASTVNSALPPVLDSILERMMARKPDDRYQTASEVIVDLERTGLAARVPSFADADQAMQDPVIRQRLSAAALATCADMNHKPAEPAKPAAAKPEFWYVRYQDHAGQPYKVRLSTAQIQKRLKEGKIPRQAEVSAQPQGTYRPLEVYPQFRDLVRTSAKETPRQPAQDSSKAGRRSQIWNLYLALGAIAAILLLVLLTLWTLLR